MIRKIGLVSALALATALGGCAALNLPGSGGDAAPVVATAPVDYVRDIHSYARPEIARVTRVALDLAADFETKTLSGSAALGFVLVAERGRLFRARHLEPAPVKV